MDDIDFIAAYAGETSLVVPYRIVWQFSTVQCESTILQFICATLTVRIGINHSALFISGSAVSVAIADAFANEPFYWLRKFGNYAFRRLRIRLRHTVLIASKDI